MNKITQSISASSRNSFKSFVLVCFLVLSSLSFGQLSYTTIGSTYTQNFSNLPSNGSTVTVTGGDLNLFNSGLNGWYFTEAGSAPTPTTVLPNTGSTNSGDTYNFGSTSAADRALGGIQSGSSNPTIGFYVTNNTGSTVGSVTITYIGEQWRLGATARVDRLDFQYSTNATSLTTGTWVDVNSLDFTAPVTSGAVGALDGNLTANRTTITQTITGLSIPNGSRLFIRWNDFNATGSDDGLAVDDFQFVANAAASTPTVTTTAVSSITASTASSGGDVTSDGGASVTARGVAFGTSANPTTGTSDGTGTGVFTSSLTGLAPNTQYFYRAYATNTSGTSYGSESNFYTLANVPGILTVDGAQLNSLNVTVSTTTQNSNSAATQYAILEAGGQYVQANGSLGVSAVWQTAATWSTVTVTGLSENTTYTFSTKARNQDLLETAFGGTTAGTTSRIANFANVQFPTTTQNINQGSSITVYAQVYEPGLTESAGAGAGLSAWIGYSSTNDNPANAGWTWVAATFNTQSGNNDEFQATIGASLPVGTYYYASRFQIGSGPFAYGGAGGVWSNNSVTLNVNPNVVDFANIQFPTTATITEGGSATIYARVFEAGDTPNAGASPNISAWIGYSSSNTNPNTGSWTWVSATFNTQVGNDDEYQAAIGSSLPAGTYYYASRFQKTGSTEYVYGGTAGIWNNNSGVLTVNADLVDYAAVQFPGSTSITEGSGSVIVYTRVYEPSYTEAPGANAGLTAELGYSSSNTNPSSGGWTWLSSTYNVQVGNDDEYQTTLGVGLPAGTYYYAARFKKSTSASYQYGGFVGVWNNNSGVLTVNASAPTVTPASFNGTVGVAFSENIVATFSPTSYAISSGTLPSGLNFDTVTGAITGTPTSAGSFSIQVTASNGAGTSAPATIAFTIAQGSQTITFGALAPKIVGDAPFALTATASSGLTVTYSSSNTSVATVSGNTVTIVGAGSTIITASQAGDSNYLAATNVDQTLVVNYPVIAGWDFTGFGSTTVATVAATTFNSNLIATSGANNITRGAGAAWSTGSNSFRTQGFQNNGIATSNTDYFQTTLSVGAGRTVSLGSVTANMAGTATFAASPGVSSQFAYSLDGTNFTLIGTPVVTVGTPASLNIDLSGVAALQNVPAGTTITIRYYASGQTGTGGWGFNSPSPGTNGLAFTGFFECITPSVFNVTGGGTICANANTAIGLSGSQLGMNYQLKLDGNNLGTTVAGTGSAISLGNHSTPGTYTVEASNTNGTCLLTSPMNGSAIITTTPIPTLDTITATPACAGSSSTVTLTGLLPNTAGSFLYTNSFTGATQYPVSGTSDSSGNFTFNTPALPLIANGAVITIVSGTVTATGCTTTFSGKTVNVVVNTNPSVSIVGNNSPICSSSEAIFSLIGTVGSVVTYNFNGNANQTVTLTGGSANLSVSNATATQTLNLVSVSLGSCTVTLTDSSTVNLGTVTTWNGTAWDNGVPTSTSAVIFTGNYTISADLDACSITVSNNAVVSVTSGFNVTLYGAVTVSSGSFTVNNNANLIQLTDVANSGNITVKRLSSALMRQDYTIWSSPVAGQNLLAFSPNTLLTRFYNYNTTTNLYNAVPSPATTNFAVGQGYLIRTPNNFPLTPTVWPGSFTGVPNNGTINVALNNVAVGQRFNAVGNPYPSAIDMNEFVADNAANITGTLYFWRKTNNAPGNAYCTWTAGTFVTNNQAQVFDPNNVIRTGQGFLVEATTTGTTLEFNNSQRTADNANQFFKTTAANATTSIERNRMWLNLTNESGDFHQMAVGYITDATQGVDAFDGKFFNEGPLSLNSIINNEKYVIQGRALPFNDTDVVPLSLTVTTAGSYTISIDHVDGFFSGDQRIFIKDNTNNSLYDLKAGNFTFSTDAGTFNNRFEIVYRNPREANIQASQCGQTVTALNQSIYANLVSGAQAYRFRVTNVATNEVQSIDKTLRVFNLAQLPNYAYDRTYTVEVAVKYNNVWQPFGNACQVVTPIAYTKIQASQCSAQLQSVNDVIYADLVGYSTGYRFRITNTVTNESVVVDRPLRDIRLSSIGESQTNTAYLFEVAVRNTDGTYLPYGQLCTISSPINDTGKAATDSVEHTFKVTAYPNPFGEQISFNVTTDSQEMIQVKVYDMLGELIESKELNSIEESEIQLGASYPTGVYNVIVTQGATTETVRVIKR